MHKGDKNNAQKPRALSHIIDKMRPMCGYAKLSKKAIAILLVYHSHSHLP